MEIWDIAKKIVRWSLRWFLFLVIICLGSSYLIRYYTYVPANSTHQKLPAGPAANEAPFHAAMDAGDQAIQSGDYNRALQQYLGAEHTAGRLTDEQYDRLKDSRLKILHTFEQGTESYAAQKLYRVMADCALHQGRELFRAAEYEDTLTRAQEAEEFSSQLDENRSQTLQASIYLSVEALEGLHQYPQAVEANQRLIDYLNSAPGDNEAALSLSYDNLASIYMDAEDWPNSEQALTKLIDRYNGLITQSLSDQHMNSRSPLVFSMIMSRDRAKSNLVVVYYLSGDTDTALSKAENYYNDPATYQPHYFASIALDIAIKAQREDAIERWRGRGGVNYGIVKVMAVHPPDR